MAEKEPLMGLKSTMNDEYQLNLRNMFDEGINKQPNWNEFRINSTKLASSLNKFGMGNDRSISWYSW